MIIVKHNKLVCDNQVFIKRGQNWELLDQLDIPSSILVAGGFICDEHIVLTINVGGKVAVFLHTENHPYKK